MPTRLVVFLAAVLAGSPSPAAELPPWEPVTNETEAEAAAATDAAATDAAPTNAPTAAPAAATNASSAAPAAATNASSAAPATSTPQSPQSAPSSTRSRPVQSQQSLELPPLPVDPNDAPFMRAPNNQLATHPPRTRPDIRRGWSARRRVALTLAPAFASLRLPFLGRLLAGGASPRLPGAGVNAELDVQLYRWIWLRGMGFYSGHPVDEVRIEQEMQVIQTAPRGSIHVIGFGAGPVFALDLGRFLPLIEVGVAGLRIVTPNGGSQGHRGEACLADGGCDVGLQCNSAQICEVSTVGEVYLGGGVDVLVRRHVSFGAQFRYNVRFVSLRELKLVPEILLATVRMTVRF